MTVLEMCLYLGDLLNDNTDSTTGEGQTFNAAKKLRVLNRMQDKFMSMVVNEALTEMELTKAIANLESTGYDLSGLATGQKYFRYVNSKNTTDNIYITRIESGQVGETDNSLFAGTEDDPKCYIFKNYYWLLVATADYPKNVQLWYIKRPSILVVSGPGSGEVSTCQLNPMFHGIICRMANAEMKSITKDYENAAAIIQDVNQEVIAINGNYKVMEKSNE